MRITLTETQAWTIIRALEFGLENNETTLPLDNCHRIIAKIKKELR